MFFRREKPKEPSFDERLESVKRFRFAVESQGAGKAKVSRDGIGAVIEERPGTRPHVDQAGLMIGNDIGLLVNAGYQMFWRTPSGRRVPATAQQLKALHNFQEDLKEALGLTSLYNESLGTTSDLHLYDRLEHRDDGRGDKPWEHRQAARPV